VSDEIRVAQEMDAETQPGLDAAGQSLAHALRLSFRVLTFVILFLLVVFVARGFFTVEPGEKKLILRFGRADERRVMDQGIHYAFPYPVDEVITIDTKSKKLEVNTFWPKVSEEAKEALAEDKLKEKELPKVVPGAEGGFMLTGDLNILEARWDVTYRVNEDPRSLIKYFNTVGSKDNEEDEQRLIKVAMQSAIIREVGRLGVFEAYPRGATALPSLVKNTASRILKQLDCGLELEQVNLKDIRPPMRVKDAFDEVLSAQQMAASMKTSAERDAKKTLIDAAGEVGIELGKAIEAWWAAREQGRTDDMQEAQQRIRTLFAQAGGKARTIIAQAQAYKTAVVQEAKADAAQIQSLLANPPRDVKTFLDHFRVEALQEVLNNCYEKYLYQPIGSKTQGTLEIWLNRRPELLREMRKVEETR